MISTDNVKAAFSVLSNESNTTLYLPLILGAINEVDSKLKADCDKTQQRVINLCAALANLRYIQSTAARDKLTHSYAGKITQTRNASEKLELALSMFCGMLKNCEDILEDRNFYFMSTEG
ncbi:MAG: hypothetical protein IJO29_01875 [Oscillospiraceae bacterium]|nr:hypothetical protein [Oscillospiraceae bacterium]